MKRQLALSLVVLAAPLLAAAQPAPSSGSMPVAASPAPTTTAKKLKAKPKVVAVPVVAAPAPWPLPAAGSPGTDYAAQVRELFRVGACGNDGPIDARFRPRVVAQHCADMKRKYASYKKAWADKATPFIAALRPADAPKTVVYPFGGGDLTSALVVFPDATEITTISLEAPGDVRAIDTVKPGQFATDLNTIGHDIGRLYNSAHSTTKSLQAASHSVIPGTLMFALAGLAVHQMEPVSLRYFDLDENGGIRYLSDADLNARVAAFEATLTQAQKRKRDRHFWYEQDSPFDKVEITYRPQSQPSAPLRVFRHIVINLDDNHTNADPRILKHLRSKGKIAAMTKAASFLLWYEDFSNIRNYLLENITWMITDASGLPPSFATPAGLTQTTYGTFEAPYFDKDTKEIKREFVKLWKNQPKRPLPFRFGYPDLNKNNHLMITERKR